jgi:hypothetical protein
LLNDDTFEEVTSFRLTRKGVYTVLCTVVVVMIVLALAIVSFTPLKYYVPGYGNLKARQEYLQLNVKVDSLENLLNVREKYLQDLKKTLGGDMDRQLDTTRLKIPQVETSTN